MERECVLPSLQKLVSSPYPESDEANPYLQTQNPEHNF
jgi:hypothetical protein